MATPTWNENSKRGNRFIDISGKKFNRLTVLQIDGKNRKGEYLWLCKCESGEEKIDTGSHIRNGWVKSCGCANFGHKRALGMKHSEEMKKKMSERMKKEWANGTRKPHYGHKVSKEQKKLLSKMRRGKKNPAYIDGRKKLTRRIRHSYKYKGWRKSVFKRDDYTCQFCGDRGGYIEADHHPQMFSEIYTDNEIETYKQAMECSEFWDVDNGRTLCRPCHDTTK